MAEAARKGRKYTVQEFDDFVAQVGDSVIYELMDGEIVAMSNPTETHEQIASNIGARLKLAMDGRGCRSYQGGMMVQASDDASSGNKFRPDVVVRCGPSQNRTWITDPVVVVEVLSPSTIDIDRTTKLAFYRQLPSLRHIVLAYSDSMRIEHYEREGDGWKLQVIVDPDDKLALAAVDFEIEIEEIYFDLPF